jgi:hypothetical protein
MQRGGGPVKELKRLLRQAILELDELKSRTSEAGATPGFAERCRQILKKAEQAQALPEFAQAIEAAVRLVADSGPLSDALPTLSQVAIRVQKWRKRPAEQ